MNQIGERELWPVRQLALAYCMELNDEPTAEGLDGIVRNLELAQSYGTLRRFIRGDLCTGFVAWIRTDHEGMETIRDEGIRTPGWELMRPMGSVLFILELLAYTPGEGHAEVRRLVSEQIGVERVIAWRHDEFHEHRDANVWCEKCPRRSEVSDGVSQ